MLLNVLHVFCCFRQPVKVKETLHSGDMHNYQPLQKCVDWLRVFFKSPQKTATLPLPPICYLATERSDSGMLPRPFT